MTLSLSSSDSSKNVPGASSSAFPSVSSTAKIPNPKDDLLIPQVPSECSLSHLFHFQSYHCSASPHSYPYHRHQRDPNFDQMRANGQAQDRKCAGTVSSTPHCRCYLMINWWMLIKHVVCVLKRQWLDCQYCCTTPAPAPVADNDIGGMEVDVAGTAPAIPKQHPKWVVVQWC
jgi:hypothetical protein